MSVSVGWLAISPWRRGKLSELSRAAVCEIPGELVSLGEALEIATDK
jgi:hypothetical protein